VGKNFLIFFPSVDEVSGGYTKLSNMLIVLFSVFESEKKNCDAIKLIPIFYL